ncbi:uncharacterized protein LOC134843701 isoform X3 [Symsagittifera roscoffensis]|uniref:uncharacterized protein LOC134843701 isoform X3 n=1 Tax=Symsagittifera roscoffensis TaxID=84072 RepID=UPI00307CB9F0
MDPAAIDHALLDQLVVDTYINIYYAPMNKWFPAKVLRIDSKSGQVYVHYKGWKARFDEWIPVQSELVRQISTGGGTSKLPSSDSKKREGENDDFIDVAVLQKKSKHEQSTPIKKANLVIEYNIGKRKSSNVSGGSAEMQKYATGQMLLGQWKDGHKYVCFIQSQSNTDKGLYHVKFYDGSKGAVPAHKLSPVTPIALKEYEQWKWEEEQMKEYRKKTGKRVKTYSELMQLMKTTIADTAQPALTPSKLDTASSLASDLTDTLNLSSGDLASSLSLSKDSEDGSFVCEEPDCGKKFRKATLLLHHTKHYHKHSSLLVDEEVSKSCSADVLAGRLKEERSVGDLSVSRKKIQSKQERKNSTASSTASLQSSPQKKIKTKQPSKPDVVSRKMKSKPMKNSRSQCQKRSFKSSFAAAFQLATSSLIKKVEDGDEDAGADLSSADESALVGGAREGEGLDVNKSEEESDVFVVEGQVGEREIASLAVDTKGARLEISSKLPLENDLYKNEVASTNSKAFTAEEADDTSESIMRFKAKSKLPKTNKKTAKPKFKLTGSLGGGKFYCKLCGGDFSSKKLYDKHLSIHGLTPETVSGNSANENEKTKAHIPMKTECSPVKSPEKSPAKPLTPVRGSFSDNTKSFICPVCSQKFSTEDSLVNHQKVRLHQVNEMSEEDNEQKRVTSELIAESKTNESPAKSDFDVTFLSQSLPNMSFKKTSYASREGKLKRKKALVENLKRSKLPKVAKISERGTNDNQASNAESDTQNERFAEVSQPDENFVPVFLDPPSSADESTNDESAAEKVLETRGRNKLNPIKCPHIGCHESFRKEAFLSLHLKHIHTAKKRKAHDGNSSKSIIYNKNVPKSKISVGIKKEKGSPTKNISQEVKKSNAENKTAGAKSSKSNSADVKLKTPIKESYNDILNESTSLPTQLSPLSSDAETDNNISFSKISVRDSPLKDGLKKILTFSRPILGESQTAGDSYDSSPSKSHKRATIDDSDSVASEESEGWSGEVIRCVCEDTDIFGTMVQCNFCDSWLHGECLGVTEATLPDTYECPYCEAKKRVRKSNSVSNNHWFMFASNNDSSLDPSKEDRLAFDKETLPWINATNQFAEDFYHLKEMLHTLEVLNSIMQDPGHPEYPQLVLRFQHALHTFDSEASALDHCDLDPTVVKLLAELGDDANEAGLTSPVQLPPQNLKSTDSKPAALTASGLQASSASVVALNNETLTLVPTEETLHERAHTVDTSAKETDIGPNMAEDKTDSAVAVDAIEADDENPSANQNGAGEDDFSLDSGVGPSHEVEDIDLNSSLEIDEDSRDDKIPTRPKTTTPPDSIGGNDVETHRSHPIDTWISPQKMSLEKCKRRMSASGKTELFEEDDIRNQQLILNEEIDLSASLSLSSYKSNIES